MKWKHLVRYPFDIRTASRVLAQKSAFTPTQTRRVIALDLYTDQLLFDCGRHLTCIAAHAFKIESELVLRCRRWLLSAIAHKQLGMDFLTLPNVRWVSPESELPAKALTLLDVPRSQADRPLDDQTCATMLIGRDCPRGLPDMPYPMHPDHILRLSERRKQGLRELPKSGIFFAGNQKSRYGRESMTNDFGVLPRLEILSTLRTTFPDRIAEQDSGGCRDKIVLRDRNERPIASADWLTVLGSHRFFLCCPGAAQPVCHNVVEAMSTGAVPILEYDQRLNPALEDGKHAICFRGRRGLIEAIERIDAMGEAGRQAMSHHAAEYYDRYLDGTKFLRQARDEGTLDRTGVVAMRFHNENLYSPELTTKTTGAKAA
jgi:hypothetical protein